MLRTWRCGFDSCRTGHAPVDKFGKVGSLKRSSSLSSNLSRGTSLSALSSNGRTLKKGWACFRLRSAIFLIHCQGGDRGSSPLSAAIFVGASPSWLRHRILIPTCIGSNPIAPAKISKLCHNAYPRTMKDMQFAASVNFWLVHAFVQNVIVSYLLK